MEKIKVKRSSWHYKLSCDLHREPGTNICSYSGNLVGCIIFLLFLLTIGLLMIHGFYVIPHHKKIVTVALILAFVLPIIAVVLTRRINVKIPSHKIHVGFVDVIVAYLKDRKEKLKRLCLLIEFVD